MRGRREIILVALMVVVLVLAGRFLLFRETEIPVSIKVVSQTSPPIFYVKTNEKKVAFTFDISWGHKMAPKVLEVLREYDVRGTFFISGPWTKRHSDLARRIAEEGHEIGNHGHRHDNMSSYNREQIVENIQEAHAIIKEITGQTPKYLRPPNGDYDDLVVETAREYGYETVIWAVDSLDWKNPGVDYMIRRVKKRVFPGAIILFHASDSCKQTDQALPAIIQELRKEGYEILTLSELLSLGEAGRDDPR
ncbi:polysaccharide deacetylase family sporulation protein PdaB [Calderihabitans maritimus]|uniref:Polysaccharide deacetylase family sporulation protein PdaB n=1 Tax=Calderihabitans maritimus TaxID=1246530 RepID=A0A1Z5HN79_9FIRM|nr:polysaccharide deacetylase family sporulation protein PdaB [Calderihabitans maritimus]GAW90976.1 polysaccharide deacetylase family sporulation protein PdaB [Calderihabitans maritimus]